MCCVLVCCYPDIRARRWFYSGATQQLKDILQSTICTDGVFAVSRLVVCACSEPSQIQSSQRRAGQYTLLVRIKDELATMPINYTWVSSMWLHL